MLICVKPLVWHDSHRGEVRFKPARGKKLRTGVPGVADHAASKAALAGFARGAARDLAERGITVNLLQTGLVDTEPQHRGQPRATTARRAAEAVWHARGDRRWCPIPREPRGVICDRRDARHRRKFRCVTTWPKNDLRASDRGRTPSRAWDDRVMTRSFPRAAQTRWPTRFPTNHLAPRFFNHRQPGGRSP